MDKSRWQRINEIFDKAVDLPDDERDEYLREACGGDAELFSRITALLRVDTSATNSPLDALTSDLPLILGALSLEGATIGSYEIVKELGSGGMGIVYLARDLKLKRDVALKFLPPMLAMDEGVRARFTQEARAAAALNHPNVVTVYEVSSHGPIPFIVMEYVEGISLQERLKGGRLTSEEFNRLATQLLSGIAAAHSAGIIHRDIKPGNLMIDTQGHLRILDFGLAKSMDDHALTRTGSTMGTVEYLSPEQVRGEEVDARSDLFSVGSTMYEMVAGVTPFKKRNPVAVIQSICSDTPKSLRSHPSGVSSDLERIIFRLLEKDPQNRYQSAQETIEDFERYLRGERVAHRTRRLFGMAPGIALLLLAPLSVLVLMFLWKSGVFPGAEQPPPVRVVFFPFVNLGPQEDAYFVEGFSNDLRAQFSGVTGVEILGVEAAPAGGAMQTAKALLDSLDVDYMFSGALEWDKSSDPGALLTTYTLINAVTGETVIADTLNAPATDVFSIQKSIVRESAGAIGIESHFALNRTAPTSNIEAYNFYLRGLDYYKKGNSWENRLLALEMYDRAIELDSEFALPYARKGELFSLMYYANYDHTDKRLELAKRAIDKSLSIDSTNAEGHIAQGLYYYWGFRDYERAEIEFDYALDVLPNQPEVHNNIALVLRRKGDWHGAVEHLRKAIRLNPLSHQYVSNLAGTLTFMRSYREADSLWDRVTWLSPEWAWAYSKKALTQILWRGDVDSAIAIVNAGRRHARFATLDLQYVRLLAMAGRITEARNALTLTTVLLNETDEPRDTAQFYTVAAELALADNDSVAAKRFIDSAGVYLRRQYTGNPTRGYRRLLRECAFMALRGSADSARTLFNSALKRPEVTNDSLARAGMQVAGAKLYAQLNDPDRALEYLREALATKSLISPAWIRVDPLWSEIVSRPKIRSLLDSIEQTAGG